MVCEVSKWLHVFLKIPDSGLALICDHQVASLYVTTPHQPRTTSRRTSLTQETAHTPAPVFVPR